MILDTHCFSWPIKRPNHITKGQHFGIVFKGVEVQYLHKFMEHLILYIGLKKHLKKVTKPAIYLILPGPYTLYKAMNKLVVLIMSF